MLFAFSGGLRLPGDNIFHQRSLGTSSFTLVKRRLVRDVVEKCSPLESWVLLSPIVNSEIILMISQRGAVQSVGAIRMSKQ